MQYHSFDELPVLLTVADLADVLQIGRNKAYSLSRAGSLRVLRVSGQIRIEKQSLLDYLKTRKRLLDIPHAGAIIGIAVYLPRGIFRRRF